MSVSIDNLDMLEELFNYIKDPEVDFPSVIKEYGGLTYYIPSYKTTFRNDDVIKEYKANYGKSGIIKKLARDYDLSVQQVFKITKEVRQNL